MSPEAKPKIIGIAVIALLVVGGTGAAIWMNREDDAGNTVSSEVQTSDSTSSTDVSDSATADTSDSSSTSSASYKDGTYSADGSYRSPGGNESIGIKLTIADDTITAVSVTTKASDSTAEDYQTMFKNGISSVVVGKKVSEVSVSRVSGSSLTSTGFNNALETIKTEAKA